MGVVADDRRPTGEDKDAPAHPSPEEGSGAAGEDRTTGLPPKLERWRRRSAAGAIMTGFALGLQEVFEPERKEPSIMLETSGTPPKDLPVDVELDGIAAKRSVVRIRPWLLERTGGTEEAPPEADTPRHESREGEPPE